MPSSSAPVQPWWRALDRHHWFVFSVASLAWLFDCLDQQLFNPARDGAMEDLLANKARATEFAPYTLARITKSFGGDVEGFRTAGVWVSFVLLLGLVVLPFLPETKDQPLPEE